MKKAKTYIVLGMVCATSNPCQAIMLVNDTKSTKHIELYTTVDDHVWMKEHNTYHNAPQKQIVLFRTTIGPRNIIKTVPFLLNNITIKISWGNKKKNTHEQRFSLVESQALEHGPIPHKFTRHHIIRLVNVSRQKGQETVKAELLYLPHGKNYLKNILFERRMLEKNS